MWGKYCLVFRNFDWIEFDKSKEKYLRCVAQGFSKWRGGARDPGAAALATHRHSLSEMNSCTGKRNSHFWSESFIQLSYFKASSLCVLDLCRKTQTATTRRHCCTSVAAMINPGLSGVEQHWAMSHWGTMRRGCKHETRMWVLSPTPAWCLLRCCTLTNLNLTLIGLSLEYPLQQFIHLKCTSLKTLNNNHW